MEKSKICLGTAQFGSNYGIANKSGIITDNELDKIMDYAKKNEINTFDTAANYGNSESRLGERIEEDANIITKLSKLDAKIKCIEEFVNHKVENSKKRLRVKKLHGVLLHNTSDLWEIPGTKKALYNIKENGLTEKIGVSVYTVEQIEKTLNIFKPDIIQAPFNILDQRIEKSGWSKILYEEGIELHVRSCFLQGLLTMERGKRPKEFEKYNGLRNWDEYISSSNMLPHEVALSFVARKKYIKYIIVGVDSVKHLEEIEMTTRNPKEIHDTERFNETDLGCIDPRRWSI